MLFTELVWKQRRFDSSRLKAVLLSINMTKVATLCSEVHNELNEIELYCFCNYNLRIPVFPTYPEITKIAIASDFELTVVLKFKQ